MKTNAITNRTNYLFIIVFLVFTSSFFGQTTSIPDAFFEGYLETHDANGNVVAVGNANSMGNGIANDHYVTTANISGVTNLNVSGSSIANLTGIEDFVALTNLNCANNLLTSLNVSTNIALTTLDCSGNFLTSLNVSTNTALTILNCKNNSLTSLDVSQNTNLKTLNCNYNNIGTLNVSNNIVLEILECAGIYQSSGIYPSITVTITPNVNTLILGSVSTIKTLNCANNLMTNLSLNNLNSLEILDCSINNLGSLDVSNNINLIKLKCFGYYEQVDPLLFILTYRSNISSLNLGSINKITELYCSQNDLSSLNVSNLNLLKILRTEDNDLTSLDVSLNTVLETLICYSKSFTASSPIKINSLNLGKISTLKYIDCVGNAISTLNLSYNSNLIGVNCRDNNLQILDVKNGNNNNIVNFDARDNTSLICLQVDDAVSANAGTGVYASWQKDESVIYSDNCATYVPDTVFEAYLETHDANGNIVSSALSMGNGISGDHYVTTANINTVTNLDISGLTISDLTGIEDFAALAIFNCSANSLTSIDVSNNNALLVLDCFQNSLTSLDVSNNTALQNLACFQNSITSLDVSQNTSLKILNCQNNQLTQLNVKNGNNTNFTNFDARTNLNLNCIQIDTGFTPTLPIWQKDATARFGNDCVETNVPDTNFETYLETHDASGNVVALGNANSMGNGIANDHYVTTANISSVTNLDVSSLTISDLTGVEDFTALTSLNCDDNLLTSLDVTQNTALTSLSCSLNDLTSLDLSNNTALIVLDCSLNNTLGLGISSLNITNNTNLTTVLANENNLSLIDLTNKPLLTELTIENNNFTTIDVSNLAALNILSVAQNQLTHLDVSNNSNLTELYCYTNQLTDLSVFYNNNLNTLSCNNNQINSLVLPQQTGNLIKLDLRINQMSSLDISAYVQLATLNCSTNVLTQLNVANGNNSNFTSFDATTNPNLTCIQIDNGFTPNANWTKDATASYSTNCHFNETNVPDTNFEAYLETHDANGNVVTVGDPTSMGNGIANDHYVTTSAINAVTTLTINNKNISDLTGIEDFVALTNLDCEYNQLSTVDFSSNTALVTLRCNNNTISVLNLIPNTALQTLYCNDNTINDIQLSSGSLVNLYCENNQIPLLDLSNFFNLQNVHCYNNAITSLNLLNSAGNLIDLRCNNNQLTGIDVDANINLTTFYCGNNQLTNLVLTTNTALEDLQCDNNQLTSLDVHLNTALTVLVVNNNNLGAIDITQNTAITDFYCNANQITNLDLSQNTALIEIRCQNNLLTDFVSPSTALQFINCNDNNLTSLDISQNTGLIDLKCLGNQLSTIDASANTALVAFTCSANSLTRINLKNGNNSNMTNANFDATGNANLTCIEVDNVAYSTNNWLNIDAQTSFNTNCHYGETYVPDDNFEQTLINLGYDTVLDDYVTTANISGLTILDVNSQNISDLTGIEDFTSLVNLNCSLNNLNSLDVTNNTALTNLNCGLNTIISLDVQQNVALTHLIVSQNQLTGLDVVQNVNLLVLACEGNPFNSSLDITHNTLLQNLTASSLNLTSLDISQNDDLQTIDCAFNSITALDFTGKQDLTQIRCQFNHLTDVYLRENIALIDVDVSDNLLTDLTIDNGNNTAILGAGFNATTNPNLTCIQVDNVAYSTTNWTNVDAVANFSTNCATFGLTYVPDNNFENYLETHDTAGNVVTVGDPNSMGNGIANDDYVTTAKISGLTGLDVSNLSISDLTGIADFVALSALYCDINSLTNLDVSNNTALAYLICDMNALTSLNLSSNTLLSSLGCSNNALTNLNISNNAALLQLNCANNSLTSLDVSNNAALTFLNCTFNSLTSLNVSNNTAITQLDCYNNSLTGLDISNLGHLTSLACQNNQLTSLNVKNGNNFAFVSFDARNNPNLTCIEVDSATIPSTPTWQKDATASYNVNCSTFTKIWENGAWTNGVPTLSENAIIRDNYTSIINNIEARTLTIDPMYSVVIVPNSYIKLQSNLINNGTITVENTGSFVQIDNNTTNTGSGSYITNIDTTVLDDDDRFTYFSSPSQTETLTVFNSWANMSRIWDFDTGSQQWHLLNGTESMTAAMGFAVKPATSNTFPFFASTSFSGAFNTGVFTQQLIFNTGGIDDDNALVGNPYPSAIDAAMLLNNNPSANAFYFWTHKSSILPDGSAYAGDDYAIWNNSGGIASASGSPAPTGFIASGQGFFVEANATGTLTFDNAMRVTGNNTDFRRPININRERIWLNLQNENYGVFNQILLNFSENGTSNFDAKLDANRFNTNNAISFYSNGSNQEHFAIQALPILADDTVVPLGFEVNSESINHLKIEIDHSEIEANTTVYLYDRQENVLHNLSDAAYNFTTTLGNYTNRFELLFRRDALSTPESIENNENLIVSNYSDTEIQIQTKNGSNYTQIELFDILGKELINQKTNANNTILNTNIKQGTVLFVKAKLKSGKVLMKKFIKM